MSSLVMPRGGALPCSLIRFQPDRYGAKFSRVFQSFGVQGIGGREIRKQGRPAQLNPQAPHPMKSQTKRCKLLLLAAAMLPMALPLYASQHSPLVGPRPLKPGDENIIKSSSLGYLRIFTPERKVVKGDNNNVWKQDNYRVRPKADGKARTGYYRRPLALDPGTYVVSISGDTYEEEIRVSIQPGQITSVWLNDSDRPKFATSAHPLLVRDAYGDYIGYRPR